MPDWGYKINNNNLIDLDLKENVYLEKICEIEPSFKQCIACGTCAGTCSTGNFTQFSLRKIIALLNRGEIRELSKELAKCMLCGKCSLVCPRDVNTRNVIVNTRNILKDFEVEYAS
jgi:heterodisulfide reductase subunit C